MKYFGYDVVNKYRSHTPKGFYDKIKGHSGLDVACPIGTPLSVPWETTCVEARKQQEMGNTIYLEDKLGNIAVFAHLKEFKVRKGDVVRPGAVFGISGNTGSKTTAPHVHYETIARRPEKGAEEMTRTLSPFTGFNVDPENYWQRMSRISAWKRMTAALRSVYARINRTNP